MSNIVEETSRKVGAPDVKSTLRALLVLEALADGEGRSLSGLGASLGLPKSSLHGILRTMAAHEWLSFDAETKEYSLGVKALVTGQAYLQSDPVASVAEQALDQIVDEVDETVHLGQLVGPDIVYLAKAECSHPLRLVSAVGKRLPAHATALGKVLLAHRSDEEARAQLRWPLASLTPSTITDAAKLSVELSSARDEGFAVDWGESTVGVRCYAVAVRVGNPPRYALSCSVPDARSASDTSRRVVGALTRARDEIEAQLALSQLT